MLNIRVKEKEMGNGGCGCVAYAAVRNVLIKSTRFVDEL